MTTNVRRRADGLAIVGGEDSMPTKDVESDYAPSDELGV